MNPERARTPDEIRQDVRRTRSDMDDTLGVIEDRVSPSRIRERQQRRLMGRLRRVRYRVMGAPRSVGEDVKEQAQDVADAARQAPDEAMERTSGNPVAAGMIAFGAGALLGTLLPATEPEQEAAQALREGHEDDARETARGMAEKAKDELGESARQATEEVKETAEDAAETTKEEAQQSAQELRREGAESKQRVQES